MNEFISFVIANQLFSYLIEMIFLIFFIEMSVYDPLKKSLAPDQGW